MKEGFLLQSSDKKFDTNLISANIKSKIWNIHPLPDDFIFNFNMSIYYLQARYHYAMFKKHDIVPNAYSQENVLFCWRYGNGYVVVENVSNLLTLLQFLE